MGGWEARGADRPPTGQRDCIMRLHKCNAVTRGRYGQMRELIAGRSARRQQQ